MNAQRRKRIIQAVSMISNARELLEEILEEENDAYDNMPESLQDSDRGSRMQDYISSIEDAISQLEEAEEVAENCDCEV